MADTIIDNINSIIRTKSELKSVLTENGQNPSDTFSEYPDMFRSVIASGTGADEETINSYISAYLGAYNFIDQDTLSANSYITLQDIPSVDLSSYVTYDFLNAQSYVTQTQINNAGYLTSIPNTYPTYTAIENMAYITMADVSACGYVTANDIPSVVVPVVDENLIPKETATYTLGDSSHLYSATYTQSLNINNPSRNGWAISSEGSGNEMQLKPFNTQRTLNIIDYYGNKIMRIYANSSSTNYCYTYCTAYLQNTYTSNLYSGNLILSDSYNSIDNANNTRINFKINQNNRFKMTNVEFAPVSNSGVNLGTNSEHFKNTYSYNYYTGFNTALTSNSDYNLQFSINGATRFGMDTVNFFPNGNGNKNLGTTANQWAYTYTQNIILNGTDINDRFNNFIWTGTSAEYAALDNYTTYQIYMIKES